MDETTRLYKTSNNELTTRDRFKKMLIDRGMFADQAEQVMLSFTEDVNQRVENYQMTWDSPACEYPDALYTVMGLTLKEHAAKWIAENAPNAWYRAVFQS